MEMDGVTGLIKFDENGFRSDFELDVFEIMTHDIVKVSIDFSTPILKNNN